MPESYVYISRWNEFTGEPGIALLKFGLSDGNLTFLGNAEDTLTAGCSCIDRERAVLYVTNEVANHPGFVKGGGGEVCAFRIDPRSGGLTPLSRVPSCFPCPTYLSLDPTGRFLVCANHSSFNAVTKAVRAEDGTWRAEVIYDDAGVDLFELNGDGSIGALADVAKHTVLRDNFMLHSHPHSAVWAPSGDFFACCDKGDDRVYMYRIDRDRRRLALLGEPYQDERASAPRYCVFHPEKPFFFNNHERKISLSSFRYGKDGVLEHICTARAVPEDVALPKAGGFRPGQKPALQALVISPNGRYLYNVVNGLGVDGVSVFAIDGEGMLELIQYERVDGIWARGAALSPDGSFLLVTCLDGDGAVLSYRVGRDGRLTPTGARVSIPGAGYVTFCTI